ncbi:MAG: TetR/AcrR family transcriptional regulator [Planctomycetota bacterium]
MARTADPKLRSRLLAAAVRSFARHGFHATSLDSIASAAGVTKGAVYAHFSAKESLFFAALDDARQGLRAALARAAGGQATGALELLAYLTTWFRSQFANRDAARLIWLTSLEVAELPTARLRADGREDQRALRADLRRVLTRGVGDGTLDVQDPPRTAFLLAAQILGSLLQAIAAPDELADVADPTGLADLLVQPLATGRPPSDGDAPSGFLPPVAEDDS